MSSGELASRAPRCVACRAADLEIFLELGGLPTNSLKQYRSEGAARTCSRGDFRLGFCGACGIIFNLAFDPQRMEYDEDYENSLHFSDVFSSYAQGFAHDLVERLGIRRKTVLEIGSGKGDFLELVCTLGDNEGWGFDPTYEGEEGRRPGTKLHFVKDFYTERYDGQHADLVLCRQVLEHVEDPLDFLVRVRGAIGAKPDTVVVFEVPNALDTLRRTSVWDLIYEHVSYFTPVALRRLFRKAGFRVAGVRQTYGDAYLVVEAYPADPGGAQGEDEDGADEPELTELAAMVDEFSKAVAAKFDSWEQRLPRLGDAGGVVLWGAGARGVGFLNMLSASGIIGAVVDVNPRKWGHHVAGSGQRVVGPDGLVEQPVRHVIITNPIYRNEIRERLNSLGIHADILIA